jgi:hypothetical protein
VYGGDKELWIAAAHTLKARMYMHLAELDASNYAKALTETDAGIASPTATSRRTKRTDGRSQSLVSVPHPARNGHQRGQVPGRPHEVPNRPALDWRTSSRGPDANGR